MRQLPVYLLIAFQSILVSCSGLGGGLGSGDPVVIENCTNRKNSESVCTCVAKKLKANASEDVYANYINILRNMNKLVEEEGLEEEAKEADNLIDGFKIFMKSAELIDIAGEKAGLNQMETLGTMQIIEEIFQNAINNCRA